MRKEPVYNFDHYTREFSQGNERALEHLYYELVPALALFANGLVNDRSSAEDIAATAMIKAWKHHSKFDTFDGLRAYLYKTVRRDCWRELKRSGKKNKIEIETANVAAAAPTPFDELVKAETYRQVQAAINQLSPGNRRVIAMHFIEGKSTGEIARELNVSTATVKTQKLRGMQAMKKLLPKYKLE